VLVDIIGCWEGIWHRYPKYFHFVYSSYGKYTTQHSHHDSGANIWLLKTGEIIHIAQGYHHRIYRCCCSGWHTLAMNELVFNVIPGRELINNHEQYTIHIQQSTTDARCASNKECSIKKGGIQQSTEQWWALRSTECECVRILPTVTF